MKRFSVIFLILFLILFTALVKNSTKRVDDEIFATEESIRILKKDFENIKLEHNYLSSADNLLEFQTLYFEEKKIKKDIQKIKIINQRNKRECSISISKTKVCN